MIVVMCLPQLLFCDVENVLTIVAVCDVDYALTPVAFVLLIMN